MKKRIIIKENGNIKKIIDLEFRDEAHFLAQLRNSHKVTENKKKYNRKKYKKSIDIE